VLVTFGAHMADHVLEKAESSGGPRRWAPASMGSSTAAVPLRELVYQHARAATRLGSRAAIMLMLALRVRDLPRAECATGTPPQMGALSSALLKGKTVGIFGVGAIARSLAREVQVFGMRVPRGITSAVRDMGGFDGMVHRDELERVVGGLDFWCCSRPTRPKRTASSGRRCSRR